MKLRLELEGKLPVPHDWGREIALLLSYAGTDTYMQVREDRNEFLFLPRPPAPISPCYSLKAPYPLVYTYTSLVQLSDFPRRVGGKGGIVI